VETLAAPDFCVRRHKMKEMVKKYEKPIQEVL